MSHFVELPLKILISQLVLLLKFKINDQKRAYVNTSLANLNERGNAQQMINSFTSSELKHVVASYHKLSNRLTAFIELEPELEAVATIIINRIEEKKMIMERLLASISVKNLDLIDLPSLQNPISLGKSTQKTPK